MFACGGGGHGGSGLDEGSGHLVWNRGGCARAWDRGHLAH